MPFPIPRPISGRRLAPKIRMMIMRMMMSSGSPTRPSMVLPFCLSEGRGDCTTLDTWRRVRTALAMAAVLGGVLPWAPLSAQFTSGVNGVEVYAAVTDRNGYPVTGLRREDFTVLEDGRPQTVSAFAEGDLPLSVAVGLDRSFSMGAKQ